MPADPPLWDDYPPPVVSSPTVRARDVGWMVATVVAGALVVLRLLGTCVVVAVGPRGMAIVEGLGGALVAYWFARGSWLRTCWGRPPEGTPPQWDEPVLTERWVNRYTLVGVAVVLAACVALAVQAIQGGRIGA